jgi:hypothetical protein
MSVEMSRLYYANAVKILAGERRSARQIDHAWRILNSHNIPAGMVDWLTNPFVRTALGILEKFQSNYKVKEAIKLLKEAGEEAKQEKESRKRGKR